MISPQPLWWKYSFRKLARSSAVIKRGREWSTSIIVNSSTLISLPS
jgi:hypothetical protein